MTAGLRTTRTRIMVALDGSPQAETVLPYAASLALATSSKLHLVTVAQPQRNIEPGLHCAPDLREISRWEALEYLASVEKRLAGLGLEIESEVPQGDPASTLIECAESDTATDTDTGTGTGTGIIAMTTYGRSGPGEWPLDSVTERVLYAVDKPLLLVRPGNSIPVPPLHTFRSILVPLDGSAQAEQALEQARSLALGTGATIILVSAVPPPDDTRLLPTGVHLPLSLTAWGAEVEYISCYLQRVAHETCQRIPGLSVVTDIVAGRPAEAIQNVTEQSQADLIVMSTHGGLPAWSSDAKGTREPDRNHLSRAAMKIARSARAPVLLVRPEA